MNMRHSLIAIVTAALLSTIFGSVANADVLAPGLQNRLNPVVQTASDSPISVVVFINAEPPVSLGLLKAAPSLRRDQRIKLLLGELLHRSLKSCDQVAQYLNENSSAPVTRHWIVPAFTATLTVQAIHELADLPGVKLVVENLALEYVVPVNETPAPSLVASVSSELALLKVPYLWQRGLKGSGRLVCSFDTGVESDHPALTTKWRGNHAPLSSVWFSRVAPDELPYDAAGHGTHTMGLMVGAVEADSFGVAPEAEWITAGVIDQGRPLQTTLSDIIEAFQWALNPDGDTATTDDVPDVILNSWGLPKGLFNPCDETFTGVIDVVEAAGIVTIFAAGNEGPDPMSLRSPADQATTPINALAVGAVDINKQVANFSSRGPSSCDQSEIKPEVMAPGVSVRSSQRDGGYSYMSGTSMAAPYVAGLVALMRQYNPDATVEQIKYALLQATEDLGPVGEDNTYGHGLVDASRLLSYLPLPAATDFQIAGTQITDDGLAWPGETFGLQVILNNPAGNVVDVVAELENDDVGVTINTAEAAFFFGNGGATAINAIPYEISFDPSLFHGQNISFRLRLRLPEGGVFDSLALVVTVGVAPLGLIAEHNSSRISFSVSDFAQFGFGTSSIYAAGGQGFRIDDSDNLLYEAGIIVGRNSLQLSSSIRDAQGNFRSSDYEPTLSLSTPIVDGDGSTRRVAGYVDSRSEIPIPIELTQETISYTDDGGILIVKFQMRNITPGWLTGLHFGFLMDFDFNPAGDGVIYDEAASMLYQTGGEGPMVGLVSLKNLNSFAAIDNGAAKKGFSRAEKYELIANTGIHVDPALTGDLMMLISSGSFAIEAWDSSEVAFAIVVGDDEIELYENAQRARERFDLATSVDDDQLATLPGTAQLHQNYPNPFNPTTTISFSLSRTTDVSLTVYNALGQKVKQLAGARLPAGTHACEWDGSSDRGGSVASGVYFYRLQAGETSHSRKMLLLK